MPLIRNLADYLLGIDKAPAYILPLKGGGAVTANIGRWWFERWCQPRIGKDGTLDAVETHTLVHPIQHGAKVRLPEALAEEPYLFEE